MVRYCQNCGQSNPDDNIFCIKCGDKLRDIGIEENAVNNDEHVVNNNQNNNQHFYSLNKKDHGVAVLLSAIIPGAGYLYIKDVSKFLIYFLTFLFLGGMSSWTYYSYEYCYADYLYQYYLYMHGLSSVRGISYLNQAYTFLAVTVIILLVLIIIWIYQVYKIHKDVKKHNQLLDMQYGMAE